MNTSFVQKNDDKQRFLNTHLNTQPSVSIPHRFNADTPANTNASAAGQRHPSHAATMKNRSLQKTLLTIQRKLSHPMPEYVQAARQMLYLVKAVDLTNESLYTGPALERALWRYEALWLPLVVALTVDPKHKCTNASFARKVEEIRTKNFTRGGLHLSGDHLVPPIDVAWVWHCHRLNPVAYATDTAALTEGGGPLNTTLHTAFRFSNGEDSQSRPLRRLWKVVFPFESYVPRYLLSCTYRQEEMKRRQSITSYANELSRAGFRTLLSYDIGQNAMLQRTFLYQVIDENDVKKEELYETNAYLNRAFYRYLLFLSLHSQAGRNTLLVPMKDINIMWQMHLSCSREYKHDCLHVVGYTIEHDSIAVENLRKRRLHEELETMLDSGVSIDESLMEDSEIREMQRKRERGVSIKETKALWESCYGTNPRYDLPGTLYRGQPPGDRGGFKMIFEKQNGSRVDLPLSETIARMFASIVIAIFGLLVAVWSFYRTMVSHANYLLGVPSGVGIVALGIYCFLVIPISRPLSSESRFWQQRTFKNSHNPLPTYLVSSTTINE